MDRKIKDFFIRNSTFINAFALIAVILDSMLIISEVINNKFKLFGFSFWQMVITLISWVIVQLNLEKYK